MSDSETPKTNGLNRAADRAAINRANAQKSTGPRSAAGKQRSSLNALRHGLTGHVIVLPSEDHTASYQHHTRRFFDDLQPKGALRSAKGAARTAEPVRTASRRAPFCASSLEEQLVQSIADTSWRLNRVA